MSKRNTARIVVGFLALATATATSWASVPRAEPEAPSEATSTEAVRSTDPPTPSLEARPLGKPNSALSARPVEDVDPQKESVLARFDPRRNEIMRVAGALAAVIGLLMIVRTVVKRAGTSVGGGERPSGVLEVLARYPMGRGQQLILVKLARRIVLLHQSGTSMAALSEMTDRDEVAATLSRLEAGSSVRGAAKFRTIFNEFLDERGTGGKEKGADRSIVGWPEAEVVDLTRGKKR